MPQDAFTLRHIARELDEQLRGGKVNKIIQPSRDEIDILLYAGGKTKKLVLNTNASFARAILSDIPRTAPDVAPNFCMLLRKYITGAQLLSVAQCGFERIISFTFDCCGEFSRATRILYAEIMGKYSNLILTENGIIAGALKISSLQENFKRALFPGVRYLPPEPQDKADPSDEARLCERLSAFQGGDFAEFLFGNLSGLALPTCRILADKLGNPDRPFGENVAKTAQRIREFLFSDEVSPAVERVNGEARDFHARYIGEAYPTVCAAADAYYTERETKRNFNEKKRKLESLLQARRKKEEKKLALLRERENSCADMEKNRIFGELITANLYALRKGAEGCEVVNYYDENAATVRIALDKTLTPAQNAQKYYKKYNKQKRTLAAVAPQKAEAESDLDYTESMLSALSRAENTLDLTEIEQELRDTGILPPEKKKVKNAPVVPFRVFAVGKFCIFAGRNNVQNDRLLREAAPDDLWLHTQKYHSSHVLIRTEGRKIPDEVLLAAAEICACFSDAKQGNKIPVDYCRRRFVKKPPRAKAGFVTYTDFKTILADPKRHAELEI